MEKVYRELAKRAFDELVERYEHDRFYILPCADRWEAAFIHTGNLHFFKVPELKNSESLAIFYHEIGHYLYRRFCPNCPKCRRDDQAAHQAEREITASRYAIKRMTHEGIITNHAIDHLNECLKTYGIEHTLSVPDSEDLPIEHAFAN